MPKTNEDFFAGFVIFPILGLFLIIIVMGLIVGTMALWGLHPIKEMAIYLLRIYSILVPLWWLFLAVYYVFTRKK